MWDDLIKIRRDFFWLTNDGDLSNRIQKSVNNHEKEYRVRVNKPITEEFLTKMAAGVPILDTVTKKCKVYKIDNYSFKIIITQGLNRQIRRMCEYFGYRVVNLKRTRVINIRLGDLKPGEYRVLSDTEEQELRRLTDRQEQQEQSMTENKRYVSWKRKTE